ncbi:MAG: YfhO family protein, partial [Clostridia bacterium]|nr:YfhO family protein [Clostridia bacterium]
MNNENIDKNILHIEDSAPAVENSASEKKPGLFQKIFKSPYLYLSLCFALPVVVMYLSYLAMQIHPFGDGSVLVLDLNGQYVYFFEALRNFVHGDASLLYSFSRALGGEFMGIYAYYLASPLSYLVALFPQGRMLEALLCLFLLKTGGCGLTFGYYLHKTSRKPNRISVVCFSMLYALSAYCIVQQHNTMWIDC